VSASLKLAAFAAALAVLFGGAALAGAAIGPEPDDDAASRTSGAEGHTEMATSTEGDHGEAVRQIRGLSVAEDGLRVIVADPELRRGRTETLRFRVVDENGVTVRDFDVEHEKRMHLIIARRDLTGFQHLHPRQTADGTWRTKVRLDEAGSYRLFADFSHKGEARTLATDLRVDGPADLRPLPAAEPTAVSDGGYDVRLDPGSVKPGKEADLRFTITKDGVPVHTEEYLGAGGHLVALREGDLAYLHVHPTEDHADEGAEGEHDDSIGFAATFPTTGRYRLFLQFKHEGRVHTVAFTQEVR
jgi:hypothetical protein